MATGTDLIRLLTPNDEVVIRAYHESPEFHAMLDVTARAAPAVLRAWAAEALRVQVELESRISRLAHLPPPNAEQLRRELGIDGVD